MNYVSPRERSNGVVLNAIHEALQKRVAPCEVIRLYRMPEHPDALFAKVRWGVFRVEVAVRDSWARALAGGEAFAFYVDRFEREIGQSIERAVADLAHRAIDEKMTEFRRDADVRINAYLVRIASLEAAVAQLRRPWYQKLWSWLTTYERRGR